jgi:hypothetical protein
VLVLLVALVASPGCHSRREIVFDRPATHMQPFELQVETPLTNEPLPVQAAATPSPLTVRNDEPQQYWPLSVQDVIRLTLENRQVMRDLGLRVLPSAETVTTIYDPAITEVDPRFGVQAALAAFDANLATSLFFDRDERTLNNLFFGGGTVQLEQNTAAFAAELSKIAATGTRFSLRNVTDYNRNNAPNNRFPSAYNTNVEMEARHPLLQGSGIDFNRIAGPSGIPGIYNGVLISRINTDISLSQLEVAVRDLLYNVEQTYWELYFAYRNLDAWVARREQILARWRNINVGLDPEIQRYSLSDEAPVREQYYQIQSEVYNALSGSPDGLVGVYELERQLRTLMGIPATDGRLIRPSDDPLMARAVFDWGESVELCLLRRSELRRQLWIIKSRELELLASRNFLRPRLDLVGLYRWRGFGDEIFGNEDIPNDSVLADLFGGDLQGWQMGLEFNAPLGFRQGHAAVRHAELQLARERAVLAEQQRIVVNQLSSAFAEMDRAMMVSKANYNRSWAARQRASTARAKYELGNQLLEIVLDAEALVTEADSEFYRSIVQYTQAVSDMHLARGTYLDYVGVYLAEGPWADETYRAAVKQARRFTPRHLSDICCVAPGDVSQGAYPQRVPDFVEVPTEALGPPSDGALVPGLPGEMPVEPLEPSPGDLPPPAFSDPARPPEQAP